MQQNYAVCLGVMYVECAHWMHVYACLFVVGKLVFILIARLLLWCIIIIFILINPLLHYALYLDNVNLAASTVDFILPIVSVSWLFCLALRYFFTLKSDGLARTQLSLSLALSICNARDQAREQNRNHYGTE